MASRMPWRRPEAPVPAPGISPQRAALEDERRRLSDLVAESTWDLGGLVYEMAVRDHFRVDVLVERAAVLQRLDARLSEIERLADDHAGIAGACRFCGAPHGRSAEFCWSCGERILARTPTTIDGVARDERARATTIAPAPQPGQGARRAPDAPTREFRVVPDEWEDEAPGAPSTES
ncbi:hypothetical protein [Patulibacter sp.]|uniref:hypothetical protein n=1 Tax=Patulibacter sp. TaxID=1912859 RepID=UPI0027177278|nr:hypothetical protein [Patulibacter sp.]MDO9406979.1 hypothetical protein [Patulibacter sp.]